MGVDGFSVELSVEDCDRQDLSLSKPVEIEVSGASRANGELGRTSLSSAPHSVFTIILPPVLAVCSLMKPSPSLLILVRSSRYAPFVPVPKMAPMSAGPAW